MSPRLLFAAPLALTSCALSCPPGFPETGGVCRFDEAAVLDLVRGLGDDNLVKVNEDPYMPVYSATPIERNAWVSPVPLPDGRTADELYLEINQDDWSTELDAAFPVGTVIVHEAVNREEAHGVEVKRDDYHDETGRSWWMRMVYDDGSYDTSDREACADCHQEDWRPTEGLWGIPTSAK